MKRPNLTSQIALTLGTLITAGTIGFSQPAQAITPSVGYGDTSCSISMTNDLQTTLNRFDLSTYEEEQNIISNANFDPSWQTLVNYSDRNSNGTVETWISNTPTLVVNWDPGQEKTQVLSYNNVNPELLRQTQGTINAAGYAMDENITREQITIPLPDLYADIQVTNNSGGTVEENSTTLPSGIILRKRYDQSMTLTAIPNTGYTVTWDGACNSNPTPEECVISDIGDENITATFTQIPTYGVTVSIADGGGSLATSEGTCSQASCTYQVQEGENFTVNSATPAQYHHLEALLGALAGQTLPYTISNITANTDAGGADFDQDTSNLLLYMTSILSQMERAEQ